MAPNGSRGLGDRLKTLRLQGFSKKLSQDVLGQALRVTSQQVSNWERGQQTPPDSRLADYALLFSTERSLATADPHLVDPASLSTTEQSRRDSLLAELTGLRSATVAESSGSGSSLEADNLEFSFWRYPDDGLEIAIIASVQPPEVMESVAEANPRHPDYQRSYRMADPDAVMELYATIRTLNPNKTVRVVLDGPNTPPGTLDGHLVIVGGETVNSHTRWMRGRMNLPVGTDTSSDRYVSVTVSEATAATTSARNRKGQTDIHADRVPWPPELLPGLPPELAAELAVKRDVALVARQPYERGSPAVVTLVYGLYARGTYGAARLFSAPRVRDANNSYLAQKMSDPAHFWMLFWVDCDRSAPTPVDRATDLSVTANVILTSDTFAMDGSPPSEKL